jgi:hypothetical protein
MSQCITVAPLLRDRVCIRVLILKLPVSVPFCWRVRERYQARPYPLLPEKTWEAKKTRSRGVRKIS